MRKIAKKSFTLIEVTVAITIFLIIMTSFSGIFMAIQNAWRRQTTDADLVSELRWAFCYMSEELRQTISPTIVNQSTISFRLDTNKDSNPDTTVWYWRGDSSSDVIGLGDRTVLYRGTGNNINAAYAQRRPLARYIFDNPTGNNIFIFSSNVVTIELTARSRNRTYSLRSIVRPRNVL